MDDGQLLEFIKTNLAVREPCYEQAAVVVDCTGAGDDYICRHITECIGWAASASRFGDTCHFRSTE